MWMQRRYVQWIIVTVVAFTVLSVLTACRVIIHDSASVTVEPKATNITSSTTATSFVHDFHAADSNNENVVQKASSSSAARGEQDRNVTLVVHLPETLGHALGVIAATRVIQNISRLQFSLDTQLVLRIFASPRGRQTAIYLQSCFPNFAEFAIFQDGSVRELDERTRQVYERWNNSTVSMLDLPKTKEGVLETLQMLQSIVVKESMAFRSLYPSSNATISMPFLQTNRTFDPTLLVDSSHIDDIRKLLTLDEQKCCSLLPDPDETVLHVRGYRRRRRGIKRIELGLLSPNKTADELLAHLPSGSKVAIVSPFHSENYMSALQNRGLLVRNVSQHDIQDLCFLTHAKKELVLNGTSSFAVWAATLNTLAESIRFYTTQSIGNFGDNLEQTKVPWIHQSPGSNVQYVTVEADESQVANDQINNYEANNENDRDDHPQSSPNKLEEPTISKLNVPPTTIVIQLSGEMGNNLAKIATGKGLQLWARRQFGIETELILRHQDHSKWLRGMTDTKKCFPKLRDWDFELGNGPNFGERLDQQKKWLGTKSSLLILTTARPEDIEESLSTLRNILQHERNLTDLSNPKNITMPFLLADHLALIDIWPDKFHDDFRELFEFDYNACCKTKPDPDESVFHFRNYAKEMPRHFKDFGFEELSPNKTATELFDNLKTGDKIAITSRFTNDPVVQTYVDAFKARGIHARVIEGQSGVDDFCFLLSAKKELVGCAESTYAVWAGYLGDADKVRLYSVDSPARRKGLFRHRVFNHYNWTNPKLQERVIFEMYAAEDAMQVQA